MGRHQGLKAKMEKWRQTPAGMPAAGRRPVIDSIELFMVALLSLGNSVKIIFSMAVSDWERPLKIKSAEISR
jgi:hypothetical protein